MSSSPKSRSRRAEIRKNRPDAAWVDWHALRSGGVLTSIGIALAFAVVASGILMLRRGVVPYRPGQWIPHDIVSRVDFTYSDQELLEQKRRERRAAEPRVYKSTGDVWGQLEKDLLEVPDRVSAAEPDDLPPPLGDALDAGAMAQLRDYAQPGKRDTYVKKVAAFVQGLRDYRVHRGEQQWELFVLPAEQRARDITARKLITLDLGPGRGAPTLDPNLTFAAGGEAIRSVATKYADANFMLSLRPQMVDIALGLMRPTHELDELATTQATNAAASRVTPDEAKVAYPKNAILVPSDKGKFEEQDWNLIRAEHEAYLRSLDDLTVKSKVGLAGIVLVITAVMAVYVARYQPRVVKNHARCIALAGLLLAMLLLAQVAAVGNGPLFLFGVAPTILVAMILTIAYDQRFAIGIASLHGLLVTVALDERIAFFIILWVGVLATCFLLDDIRTRSKLIEVGGAAALAMMAATAAAGALSLDPWRFILTNCLYTGASGLAVGFVVLGILPFIEKAFRITTSMTLLELADVSHPLLRRLSMEAPGTYSHSLQVATLSEAAAEAIGANSLMCRVGAYYHDVGKINKAEYFIENQQNGPNRHMNLSPSVSLLIIIGHVKDGIELAREYNLPTSITPFIQQHHGTTLVEYFYHQACKHQSQHPEGPAIPETQYRYPGPKPKSKETAIVMIADAVESASRAMPEPTAGRVEHLIHELAMKRLMDGQFDECDLTMRDLDLIERAMMKTLLGIHHGRIAYPTMSVQAGTPPTPAPTMAARTA